MEVQEQRAAQDGGHEIATNLANNDKHSCKQCRKIEQFLPFDEAVAVAQTLGPAGMSVQNEWKAWCKAGVRTAGLPSAPDRTYKDRGWQGWGHWLGTSNQSSKARSL